MVVRTRGAPGIMGAGFKEAAPNPPSVQDAPTGNDLALNICRVQRRNPALDEGVQ